MFTTEANSSNFQRKCIFTTVANSSNFQRKNLQLMPIAVIFGEI